MVNPASYMQRPVSYWIGQLTQEDPLVRRLACHALAEMGLSAQEAVSALRERLEDPISFVRVWAAAALGAVDPTNPDSVPALIQCMHDERNFVRSLAAWHLGRLGDELASIKDALPELKQLLADEDQSVRREAGLALKRLQSHGGSPPELGHLYNAPVRSPDAPRHQ